jgi:hypothetical protein
MMSHHSWAIVASLLIFSSSVSSLGHLTTIHHDLEQFQINTANESYGFIIPLPAGNDTTFETFINSRSRVLVNDLLRENISVYWATENATVLVSPIDDMSTNSDLFIKRGDFIIPFTGDDHKDKMMASVVFDYCIDSELDDWNYPLDGYLLLNPLNVESYKLVEPRIAQHFGISTRYGWPVYLQIADAGGFLTFDFFLDGETELLLNSDTYNVFMWPYEPNPARMFEAAESLVNKESFNTIRRFVAQGGGYVGSCYGAQTASSGFLQPLSLLSLTYAYHPERPSFPLSLAMSMSDTIQQIRLSLLEDLFISTSVITNHSHPLAFGMNGPVKDFFSGPWFIYLGENSECVSAFNTIILESSSTPPVMNKIVGSPNWVASNFGKGRLALFASHPEFVNNVSLLFEQCDWPEDHYYGRRVIQNSLFYVTGIPDQYPLFNQSYPQSIIEQIFTDTTGIEFPTSDSHYFEITVDQLERYASKLCFIENLSSELMISYADIFSDATLFQNDSHPLLYSYHFGIILQEYVQKSIRTLQMFESLSALETINNELMDTFADLDHFINNNINESVGIAEITLRFLDQIEDYLNDPSLSLKDKTVLVELSRNMIATFESSLKYVPQMYFEPLKTLRHFWYEYQALITE